MFVTDKKARLSQSMKTTRGKAPKKELVAEPEAPSIEEMIAKQRAEFAAIRASVPTLKSELETLERALSTLNGRASIRKRLATEKRIRALRDKITLIESGVEEKKYNEKVEKFLVAYKANQEQERQLLNKKRSALVPASPPVPRGGALLAFTVPTQSSVNRAALKNANRMIVREYLTEFEKQPPPIHITHQDLCQNCGEPLLLSITNSLLICKKCRFGYPYIDTTTAAMAYGEEVEFSSFTYKKVHHFDDWLKKVQAKGSKRVEKWVLRDVMDWLVNNGHTNKERINIDLVRQALKEKGLRKYYDHRMQIYCRITGTPPPCMTPEEEEKCRLMFQRIQAPFLKWKNIVDPKRCNFLSYSYVLFKICQLLGWTHYLQYFTLLKGREKLKKQDEIWKGICKDCDWEFTPSI